jgi:hypothetical protein
MQDPSSPRRPTRKKSAVGLALAAGVAVAGVGVAAAEDLDKAAANREAAVVEHARAQETPDARRDAWLTEVGDYVERDLTRRYAVAVYGRLAEWNAAQEYAEALATAGPAGGGVSGHLASIRECESGGDYTAVNPSGTYRGAYQFDQQTWESVGGTGDPAAAPPAEQDMRAQMLYEQRGSSPWPVCGS